MHRGGYIVCMVKITVRLVGRSNTERREVASVGRMRFRVGRRGGKCCRNAFFPEAFAEFYLPPSTQSCTTVSIVPSPLLSPQTIPTTLLHPPLPNFPFPLLPTFLSPSLNPPTPPPSHPLRPSTPRGTLANLPRLPSTTPGTLDENKKMIKKMTLFRCRNPKIHQKSIRHIFQME